MLINWAEDFKNYPWCFGLEDEVGHKDLLCSSEIDHQTDLYKIQFLLLQFCSSHSLPYDNYPTEGKGGEWGGGAGGGGCHGLLRPKGGWSMSTLYTSTLTQRIWANFLRVTKNPFWRNFEWFCITVLKESDWISREKKINKWGSREVGLDRSRSGLEMVMVTMKMMQHGLLACLSVFSISICILPHFCLCTPSLLLFTVK